MIAMVACSSDDSVESNSGNNAETETTQSEESGDSNDATSIMEESTEVPEEESSVVEENTESTSESTVSNGEQAVPENTDQSETEEGLDEEESIETVLTDTYAWGTGTASKTKILQDTLGVTADGSYGPRTRVEHLTALEQRGLPTDNLPDIVPSEVSNVLAGTVSGEVWVIWEAPVPNGGTPILGYEVTAIPGGETCNTVGRGPISVPEYGNSDEACRIGFIAQGAYTFRVVAINAFGPGLSTESPLIEHSIASGPPRWPVATPFSNGVTISWYDPVDDCCTGWEQYTVTVSPGNEICTVPYNYPEEYNETKTCTITNLTNGVQYTFLIVVSGITNGEPWTSPATNIIVEPRTVKTFREPFQVGDEWRFAFDSTAGVPLDGNWQIWIDGSPSGLSIPSSGAGGQGFVDGQGQSVDHVIALNRDVTGNSCQGVLFDVSVRLVDSNSNPFGIERSSPSWESMDIDPGTCP